MAEPKTQPTGASVEDFIAAVEHPGRREDARAALALLSEVTGEKAEMWGPSIVGFGRYRYTDSKGKMAEWPMIGFSPRKTNLVFYIVNGFKEQAELMARLGKYKTGSSCLYLNRLADVDAAVLREPCARSFQTLRKRYATG